MEADWADDLSVRIAAPAAVEPGDVLDRVEARRLDRSAQLAVIAAMEAWDDAGYGLKEDNPVDRDRLGVVIATGIGGLHTLLGQWDVQKEKGQRRVSPLAIPMLMANASAANVGLRLGARAGVHTPVSACASSNEAIAHGVDMMRLGRADVVVVGGTEACIHPMPIACFAQMQAMSRRNDEPERASRPWDVDRDGFVLGEGAAILVLETLEHAQARGARIYGEVAGAGITGDAHDMVQPNPTGETQALAMTKALREGELTAADIVHVNAHATSTPQGDVTEISSIRQALGEHSAVIVSGTKSMTGHLLGGAGALESLATLLALHHRKIPPTINLDNPEADLGLDIATKVRDLPAGDLAAINNSFGFGGHNVAVALTNAYATSTGA
jgi:3-oxoacyl-[acyl-carrier-protein] synthase II